MITPTRDYRPREGFVDEFDRNYVVRHDLAADMEDIVYMEYYTNADFKLRRIRTGTAHSVDPRRLSLDHPATGDELYIWRKKPGQYLLSKRQETLRENFVATICVESVETSGGILRAVAGREPKQFRSESTGLIKARILFGAEAVTR